MYASEWDFYNIQLYKRKFRKTMILEMTVDLEPFSGDKKTSVHSKLVHSKITLKLLGGT